MMKKLFCNWECLIKLGSFVVTIYQRPIFYGKFWSFLNWVKQASKNFWNSKDSYCVEGIERRQLAFRSADVYCQNLNNLNLRNIIIFILQQKEGEKGKCPERQRESVCERRSIAESVVGVRPKNGHWRKD
jgi:hypothetical protein